MAKATETGTASVPTLAIPPAAQAAAAEAEAYAGYTIRTRRHYEEAPRILTECRRLKQRIEDTFRPIERSISAALDLARRQRRSYTDPIDATIARIKREVLAWDARERARAAQAAATETARVQQTIAATRERQAATLRAEGLAEAAEQLLNAPLPVVAPEALQPDRPAGLSFRTTYRWEIVNPQEVAAEFWRPDPALIQAAVTQHGLAAEQLVGGIRVIEVRTPVGRA